MRMERCAPMMGASLPCPWEHRSHAWEHSAPMDGSTPSHPWEHPLPCLGAMLPPCMGAQRRISGQRVSPFGADESFARLFRNKVVFTICSFAKFRAKLG